jgi:hypothetical protein
MFDFVLAELITNSEHLVQADCTTSSLTLPKNGLADYALSAETPLTMGVQY